MFTGRRDRFLGLFPPAGVADEVIDSLARFGRAINERRQVLDEQPPRPMLRGLGAVQVERRYVIPELIGRFTFPFWARMIRAAGPPDGVARRVLTFVFVLYLVLAIVLIIPASVLAGLLLYPVIRVPLRSYIDRLKAPSGIDCVEAEAAA